MSEQMRLILKFLEVANIEVKRISVKRNYFDYMRISVCEFFLIAKSMPLSEIEYAIDCVNSNEWECSNLIMKTERC